MKGETVRSLLDAAKTLAGQAADNEKFTSPSAAAEQFAKAAEHSAQAALHAAEAEKILDNYGIS